MKATLSIVSLLLVLAIAGLLAKSQLAASSKPVAVPSVDASASLAVTTPGATSLQQSQDIQKQVRQSVEAADIVLKPTAGNVAAACTCSSGSMARPRAHAHTCQAGKCRRLDHWSMDSQHGALGLRHAPSVCNRTDGTREIHEAMAGSDIRRRSRVDSPMVAHRQLTGHRPVRMLRRTRMKARPRRHFGP